MKEPSLKITVVLSLLTIFGGALLFILNGKADNEDYTDKSILISENRIEKIIDLKIEPLKKDIEYIKVSQDKTERTANKIWDEVRTKP